MNFNVLRYESVGSTNQKAAELLARGDIGNGTAITASFQSGGKGQRGNTWSSEQGANLLVSYIIEPEHLKAGNQFLLSAVAALAVQRTIYSAIIPFGSEHSVKIKWPNDVLVENKKVSGVLIENSIQAGQVSSSIIGIGINVNQASFQNLPHASSLLALTMSEFEIDDILDELSQNLAAFFRLIDKDPNLLLELFKDHLFGLHTWLNLKVDGTESEYRVLGIEEDGRLKIEDRNFRTHSVQHHQVAWSGFR